MLLRQIFSFSNLLMVGSNLTYLEAGTWLHLLKGDRQIPDGEKSNIARTKCYIVALYKNRF